MTKIFLSMMALVATLTLGQTQTTCPLELFNSASWPQTPAGAFGSGSCVSGYSGAPQRACYNNGTWATLVTDSCVRNACPASTSQNSIFPLSYSGQTIFGTCQEGFAGRPSRTCGQDGVWGEVQKPCLRKINCPADPSFSRSAWPETSFGAYARGTCEPGYFGTPLRQCEAGGIWSTLVFNFCQKIVCFPKTENHMYFPAATSFVNVVGTCLDGYYGVPDPRSYCFPNGTWGPVAGGCSLTPPTTPPPKPTTPTSTPTPSSSGTATCGSEIFGSAQWEQTLEGEYANGACLSGSSPSPAGSPQRLCETGGSWSSLIINNCERNFCSDDVAGNAKWNATFESETTYGTCLTGFSGRPFRTCQADGTWGEITNPCEMEAIPCPSEIFGEANWPSVTSGNTAQGTCLAGYQGTPTRQCLVGGVWGQVNNGCERITCPQITEGNAIFAPTLSGTFVEGNCISPFFGNPSPSRECQLDGTWGAVTSGGCEMPPDCQADCEFSNARFGSVPAGQTSIGSCHYGYKGSPVRQCRADGTWASSVQFPCVPA